MVAVRALLLYTVCSPDLLGALQNLPPSPPRDVSTSLAGIVLNGITGLPLPRVLVKAGSRAVLTDHEGRFRFLDFTETVSVLQFVKPGFSLSPEQLDTPVLVLNAASDRSALQATLYPEAVLAGTVTAPDGTVLPHVAVSIRRSLFNETHTILLAGRSQTDSHGNFRFPVPAGDYIVQVDYTRLPYDPNQVVLPSSVPPPSPQDLVTLHVHPGQELHVDLFPAVGRSHRVTLASGSSDDGSSIRITARSSTGFVLPASGGGRSQARGEGLRSLELPSGTFSLDALLTTGAIEQVAQSTVTVTDHDLSGVPLTFAPVPSIPIEITAVDTGDTSAAQTVPTPQQLALSLQTVEPDGPANFTSLPIVLPDRSVVFRAIPGRYRLHASTASAWSIESATSGSTNLVQQDLILSPSAGATPIRITVRQQTGSLAGVVTLAGLPSPSTVYLIASDPSVVPIRLQRSSADGTFTFTGLPPGSYRAIAMEHRHSANLLDPDLLSSFGQHVQSVTLQAGARSSVNLDAVPTRDLLR